jgi:phage antirepressor YoqD-like protein
MNYMKMQRVNYSIGEVVHLIGFPGGRTKLFKWLREKKYLQESNLPYQRYVDKGYFCVREVTVGKKPGRRVLQTRCNIKGLLFLIKKVQEQFPPCPPCSEEITAKSKN